MERTKILENIIQDCYWDYKINIKDLDFILVSNNSRELQKLFSKIIYNSKDKLLSLSLFTNEQLKKLFLDFRVSYNEKYIQRHVLVLKSLLFNEKNHIKGLEWK